MREPQRVLGRRKTFDVVHASARAGMSQASVDELHAVPWCAQQLLQGQPVVLSSVPADLPTERSRAVCALSTASRSDPT